MRRSRFGYKQRTKKIRPVVRVKEKVSKKGGRCAACRARFEKGDRITIVSIKRRTYHTATCVPVNPTQTMITAIGGSGAAVGTGTGPVTSDQVAKALSIKWTFGEAKMVGLLALENALLVALRNGTIPFSEEIEKSFNTYKACKEHAMRPGSEQEAKSGLVQAVTRLARMIFNS